MNLACQKIHNRLLDTLSGVQEEKMRQKRRSIDSHFGSVDNIIKASFTIALEKEGKEVMGAYFLRLHGKPPYKDLVCALEGSCLDKVRGYILSPLLYALSSLYQLGVFAPSVTVYCLSLEMMEYFKKTLESSSWQNKVDEAVVFLCRQFPKVEILPCLKGHFFEKMQSKLYVMKRHKVSDMALLDFEVIAKYALGHDVDSCGSEEIS